MAYYKKKYTYRKRLAKNICMYNNETVLSKIKEIESYFGWNSLNNIASENNTFEMMITQEKTMELDETPCDEFPKPKLRKRLDLQVDEKCVNNNNLTDENPCDECPKPKLRKRLDSQIHEKCVNNNNLRDENPCDKCPKPKLRKRLNLQVHEKCVNNNNLTDENPYDECPKPKLRKRLDSQVHEKCVNNNNLTDANPYDECPKPKLRKRLDTQVHEKCVNNNNLSRKETDNSNHFAHKEVISNKRKSDKDISSVLSKKKKKTAKVPKSAADVQTIQPSNFVEKRSRTIKNKKSNETNKAVEVADDFDKNNNQEKKRKLSNEKESKCQDKLTGLPKVFQYISTKHDKLIDRSPRKSKYQSDAHVRKRSSNGTEAKPTHKKTDSNRNDDQLAASIPKDKIKVSIPLSQIPELDNVGFNNFTVPAGCTSSNVNKTSIPCSLSLEQSNKIFKELCELHGESLDPIVLDPTSIHDNSADNQQSSSDPVALQVNTIADEVPVPVIYKQLSDQPVIKGDNVFVYLVDSGFSLYFNEKNEPSQKNVVQSNENNDITSPFLTTSINNINVMDSSNTNVTSFNQEEDQEPDFIDFNCLPFTTSVVTSTLHSTSVAVQTNDCIDDLSNINNVTSLEQPEVQISDQDRHRLPEAGLREQVSENIVLDDNCNNPTSRSLNDCSNKDIVDYIDLTNDDYKHKTFLKTKDSFDIYREIIRRLAHTYYKLGKIVSFNRYFDETDVEEKNTLKRYWMSSINSKQVQKMVDDTFVNIKMFFTVFDVNFSKTNAMRDITQSVMDHLNNCKDLSVDRTINYKKVHNFFTKHVICSSGRNYFLNNLFNSLNKMNLNIGGQSVIVIDDDDEEDDDVIFLSSTMPEEIMNGRDSGEVMGSSNRQVTPQVMDQGLDQNTAASNSGHFSGSNLRAGLEKQVNSIEIPQSLRVTNVPELNRVPENVRADIVHNGQSASSKEGEVRLCSNQQMGVKLHQNDQPLSQNESRPENQLQLRQSPAVHKDRMVTPGNGLNKSQVRNSSKELRNLKVCNNPKDPHKMPAEWLRTVFPLLSSHAYNCVSKSKVSQCKDTMKSNLMTLRNKNQRGLNLTNRELNTPLDTTVEIDVGREEIFVGHRHTTTTTTTTTTSTSTKMSPKVNRQTHNCNKVKDVNK